MEDFDQNVESKRAVSQKYVRGVQLMTFWLTTWYFV